MADMDAFQVDQATEQSTTSSTFVTRGTAAAASMTAGNKYLVLVFGKQNSTDKDAVQLASRMAHGSTPTEFATSLDELETSSTSSSNRGSQYNWFTVFTQPGTAEDIYFQQRAKDGVATVTIQSLHMLVLDLSDLTTDQWKVATDATGAAHTGTMAARAALTWTPVAANHDWLVFGGAKVTIDTASVKYEIELYDSTGSAVLSHHFREGEDTEETQNQTLMGVLTNLPASSQTVQVRTRDTSGTANDYVASEIFVLDLDAFAQHYIQDQSGTQTQSAADTWDEIGTLEFEPDEAGDWVILAGVNHAVSGSAERFDHRLQVATTTIPSTAWEDRNYGTSFDVTDEQYTMLGFIENLAASAQTVDVHAKFVANTSQVWSDRLVVAFPVKLATTSDKSGSGSTSATSATVPTTTAQKSGSGTAAATSAAPVTGAGQKSGASSTSNTSATVPVGGGQRSETGSAAATSGTAGSGTAAEAASGSGSTSNTSAAVSTATRNNSAGWSTSNTSGTSQTGAKGSVGAGTASAVSDTTSTGSAARNGIGSLSATSSTVPAGTSNRDGTNAAGATSGTVPTGGTNRNATPSTSAASSTVGSGTASGSASGSGSTSNTSATVGTGTGARSGTGTASNSSAAPAVGTTDRQSIGSAAATSSTAGSGTAAEGVTGSGSTSAASSTVGVGTKATGATGLTSATSSAIGTGSKTTTGTATAGATSSTAGIGVGARSGIGSTSSASSASGTGTAAEAQSGSGSVSATSDTTSTGTRNNDATGTVEAFSAATGLGITARLNTGTTTATSSTVGSGFGIGLAHFPEDKTTVDTTTGRTTSVSAGGGRTTVFLLL